jgi:L-threonylcarbamoyladenylate synthase
MAASLGLVLRRGGLVIMPTETVYGLAGDATNPAAVAAIYAAKGRPQFNPLIIHVWDLPAAQQHSVFDARALDLAEHFWPGPLTLVVPRRADSPVAELACAGLDSIALRVPSHRMALDLMLCGRPLAAPSANRSGRISPTTAADADAEFDGVFTTVDGGACEAGLESTIVALPPGQPAQLLRPGAIPREAIEALIGPLAGAAAGEIKAPGMLSSHYAPSAPVRLNALDKMPGEVLIGFGAVGGDLTLSAGGDLTEAAARLYSTLRAADAQNPRAIAVAPIPAHGLGEAINDRLARAAAPR